MNTSSTTKTQERLQREEIQRIDRHNGARAAAQGLLDAVSLMNVDAPIVAAAPGLWESCFDLEQSDHQAVKDLGQLMGLLAILRAPEVLTAALKRAARELAEVADLPIGDTFALAGAIPGVAELAREQGVEAGHAQQ